MRIITRAAIFSLFLLPGCLINRPVEDANAQFLAKELLNSNWQRHGVGEEEWYYRMTVVDAPANTEVMSVAEGHYLHPELVRFEITKDVLIGHSTHASVLNAEHEQEGGKNSYRGAPIIAFPITAHFDLKKNQDGKLIKVNLKPWQERAYIEVDWSRNLISAPKALDGEEEISLNSSTSYMIDGSAINDPKRMRIGEDFLDITARYPTPMSSKAQEGHYGLAFKDDAAAPVIDVRHFFLKKGPDDFVSLPSPDFVIEKDKSGETILDQGQPKKIAINRRFGLFRVNLDGRSIHDRHKGTFEDTLINATIFNIWQKSHDETGSIIPIEKREPKPIIYYMNLLHPEDLKSTSLEAAKEWDQALREAVFHAQPNKYSSIEQVPPMWILKPNSCSIDEVSLWLSQKRPEIKGLVEAAAEVDLEKIGEELDRALFLKESSFSKGQSLENKAKRSLEKICTTLEYMTQNSPEKFIYQRPGDLRFNLLNLEMSNNTTKWSGYGPMLADPLTGEIISATANINMKYIDLMSQKMAKQIGLLKENNPGLLAVFGSGINTGVNSERLIDERALFKTHERLIDAEQSIAPDKSDTSGFFEQQAAVSAEETRVLKAIDAFRKEQEVIDHKSGFMDPLRYVDNLSIGIAIKFADLKEHERFLKIRSLIYKSVTLHELGHNLGLLHNMAAASDVLNYGEKYWMLEQLPSNIEAALKKISDPNLVEQLTKCLEQKNQDSYLNNGGRKKISTQDCLQQKNGMYSSIMDYHASSLADIDGLGTYDKAAIKWAYGQLIEVFPDENLLIDPKKLELSRWLRLNNYRHIPKVMLKDITAINQRQYQRFSWDRDTSLEELPANAVPYAFCDDGSARQGPRCLSFDFGPDMRSSALWLKDRFWQQYLLNHFAKDQSWTDDGASAIAEDIDNLKRFTNILRWYYKNSKDDPEFKGSYAEQDYLAALGIGINHFAHVLGMPEPGAHISAPIWKIEDQYAVPTSINRLSATRVLIPSKLLSACDAKSITTVKDGQTLGRFNFKFAEVPLGLGRPLNSGLSDGLERKSVLYAGSSLVKKYALYLLVAPLLSSKSPQLLEKSDLISMNWYRMFPDAVSKIYASVIINDLSQLGPLVKADGSIIARDIISPRTHKILNTKDFSSILPAVESTLPLFAAKAAIELIPKTIAQEDSLLKSMAISCRGCRDEIDLVPNDNNRTVSFTHIYGQEYSATVRPETPSIGAALLVQANRQKDRYLRLKECIANENLRESDPFCQCVKTTERKTYADWVCCDENNQSCSGPTLEKVGEGVCSLEDLQKRLSQSLSQLEETVGFVDSLRALMKQAAI